MKLSQITTAVAEADRVATMQILQPGEKPQPHLAKSGEPCTLQFVGAESETFRVNREGVVRLNLLERVEDADVDRMSLRNKTVLAACALVGWTGIEDDNEQDLPFSRDGAIALLSADHVFQQVWKNIFAHRDFFTVSSSV